MKTLKTPRSHRRCPCGSKKKYRNCCGKNNINSNKKLRAKIQQAAEEMHLKRQLETSYHANNFGHAPPIISCIFNNRRYVALRGSLVVCDDPNHDWETPSQFLLAHLKTTLGNDWFDLQFKLPDNEQHIIAKWMLNSKHKIHDQKNPIESTQVNGSAFSLLHLAYDLFIINNQGCLSDQKIASRLLNDLKEMPTFNGARYEIFVFATLIRAGFDLKLHNQLNRNKGKVTEGTAVHRKTGAILQFEAKTRNVQGVLGAVDGNKQKIKIYNKLRGAIIKDVNEPYIVFIDINLPELDVINDEEKRTKISDAYYKLQKDFPNKMLNFICFTNIPFHYDEDDFSEKKSSFGFMISDSPKVELNAKQEVFDALKNAMHQHRYLPAKFNESESYAEEALKKLS